MALSITNANELAGSRDNTKQALFGICAGGAGNDPGCLVLESSSSVAAHNQVFLWADSSGNLRFSTTVPATENSDGSVVGVSNGASSQLNNLSSTAVNASIIPAASGTLALGSSTYYWASTYSTILYLASTAYFTGTANTATLTAGNLAIAAGKITVDSVTDSQNYIKRNQTTTTGALLSLECTNTGDDYPVLSINQAATGAIDTVDITSAATGYALSITNSTATGIELYIPVANSQSVPAIKVLATSYVGASTVGMVTLTHAGVLVAGASVLRIASSAANTAASYLIDVAASGNFVGSTNGTCLRLVDSGTVAGTSFAQYIASTANGCLSIAGSATAQRDVVLTGVASKTVAVLYLTTASINASNVGTLHIANTGNLAHANATNLYVAQTGTITASSLGCCARFVDASAASATSYAVQVTSTANGCLNLTGVATAYAALNITGGTSATASVVNIVTTSVNASNIGTVSIVNTGTLASANATNLYVSQGTGTIAAATLGCCARFIDTSASATTSAAVQIASTNNRALACTTGQADFIQGMSTMCSTAACAGSTPTAAELITAFGAANTHTTGFVGVLDTGDTKCFLVFTNATSYFFSAAMTKAT